MSDYKKTEYTVILVDTPEEAAEINRKYADSRYTNHKTEAFSSFRQMVGIQHRGKRPTKIIDRIRNRNGERFGKWYESEVMRNAVKAEIIPEWSDKMTDITKIALTGKMRSGKTEIERYLTKQHSFNSVAFGDQLKHFAHKIFDDATDDAGYDPFRPGSTQKPRALYQQFGQLCREIDPDVWITHAQRTAKYYERLRDTTGIVISDLRQPNEYEWAKANGFIIVKVVTDDAVRLERARQAGDKMSEEDFVHDTESYVDGFSEDYTVVNDGDLTALRREVDEILTQIKRAD